MCSSYYNKGPTSRATVRRNAKRARYDRAVIEQILDEAFVAHVGVAMSHGPVVLPTTFVRVGDEIAIHGARNNAVIRAAARGTDVCITVTLIDGLVLAKAALSHSVNYRSVVVFGRGREIEDPSEKRRVLDALVDHVAPQRSGEVRPPTADELAKTRVIAFALDEASAKVRTGGPVEDPEDMSLPVWSGVVPLHIAASTPEPDATSRERDVPAYTRPGPWRGTSTNV